MKIIKVSAGVPANLLLRQSPGMSEIWGDCKFLINTDVAKCDWWFVLHGSGLVNTEESVCDPKHIVYVSMEPTETMSMVSSKFIDQFSNLVICDREICHPNITYMNWLTWWVGIVVSKRRGSNILSKTHNFNYDDFINMKPIAKENKLSIILSNRNAGIGHQKRLNFIDRLINSSIAKYIDVYGEGYKEIPDKWNAISQYKYHLVIENSNIKDYWSEKLADSFLGFAVPIYFGCPNILDYFSEKSLLLIDINNFDQSILSIQKAIEGNLYGEKINAIKIARNQILNEYNIFNLMSKMANSKSNTNKKIKLRTNYYYSDSWLKKILRYALLLFRR
jgi:hypothetical protein